MQRFQETKTIFWGYRHFNSEVCDINLSIAQIDNLHLPTDNSSAIHKKHKYIGISTLGLNAVTADRSNCRSFVTVLPPMP